MMRKKGQKQKEMVKDTNTNASSHNVYGGQVLYNISSGVE